MITSRDNETVKLCAKLVKSAAFRRERSQFTAEGVRICTDGVRSGYSPSLFIYTSSACEKYAEEFAFVAENSDRCIEVSNEIFGRISDTKSPQGFFCVFNMLDKQENPYRINKEGSFLACERVQDPSNLGTILRTAEALGFEGVILSDDCCDIYSPKVVRGSMGAVFRLPCCITEDLPAYISELSENGVETYASTPRNATDITSLDICGGVMLIGNEGSGLTDGAIEACRHKVMIPMRGRAESLNASAAAAMLMWEMVR